VTSAPDVVTATIDGGTALAALADVDGEADVLILVGLLAAGEAEPAWPHPDSSAAAHIAPSSILIAGISVSPDSAALPQARAGKASHLRPR
jgi:hypothetical protein